MDAVFLALAGAILLYFWSRRRKEVLPLPPGPKPFPIVGNVRDLPTKELWLAVTKMAQEFGEPFPILCNTCRPEGSAGSVFYLNVMGQGLVFLNTSEAAVDLLEKRGSIYSDRLHYVMASELCVETCLACCRVFNSLKIGVV